MKKLSIAVATAALALGLLAVPACSPQPGEKAEGDGASNEAAVSFEWRADSECGACHDAQRTSLSDGASLAALHLDQACSDCHADGGGLAGAHEGTAVGDPAPTRLKKTEVPLSLCESCHPRDEIASATAGSTALTDKNGTVANPHALADNDSHNDLECFDCHSAHEADAAAAVAQETCYSCHHHQVYECYTCHR